MLQKPGSTHPNATYPPLRSKAYCTYTHKRLFLQPGPRFAAADGAERPPPVEPLAADAFEMAQEVDDADEAALFLAFGDLLAGYLQQITHDDQNFFPLSGGASPRRRLLAETYAGPPRKDGAPVLRAAGLPAAR